MAHKYLYNYNDTTTRDAVYRNNAKYEEPWVSATGPDDQIVVNYNKPHIKFEDPEVERICVTAWGDGKHINYDQAAAVTSIKDVFKNNTDIETFEELQYFTGLINIAGSFAGSTIKKVILPSGLRMTNSTGSWSGAFYNCASLEELDLSDMTRNAVAYNSQLQTFTGCTSLVKVYYSSIEQINNLVVHGNFYTSDVPFGQSTLTHYVYINGEELRDLVIPSTITEIYPGAFYRFNRLTSIIIPNTVTTIGQNAFYECSELQSLIIPNSVTSIGSNAFAYCSNLSTITVNGNANMNAFYRSGPGKLHITGNITVNASNGYYGFTDIQIDGNLTSTHAGHGFGYGLGSAGGASTVNPSNIVFRVNGNASFGNRFFYNARMAFLEILGDVVTNGPVFAVGNGVNNTIPLNQNGVIIHLGYNSKISGSASDLLSVINTITSKVYVGDGSSAEHDNTILAQYTADSGWSTYTSKLDTWYNYVQNGGEYAVRPTI